jgi:hypothetical protein
VTCHERRSRVEDQYTPVTEIDYGNRMVRSSYSEVMERFGRQTYQAISSLLTTA